MGRSHDDVKQELTAEREQLGEAVEELHAQIARLRRRAPYVAAAAVAAAVLVKIARRRSR